VIDRMTESEKTLLEAIAKLSEKIDSYDKRIVSMGLDIAKVQSQMDLSMRSIQALQKEQIILVKAVHGSASSGGVIGSAPASMRADSSSQGPPLPHVGAGNNNSSPPSVAAHDQGSGDVDHRRHWMLKMDFSKFDGADVHIWLDKCATYFQLYAIPADFRVIVASLHMIGKASHWFQTYKLSAGNLTWEAFVVVVSHEFEVNAHRMKTMELLKLKQIRSVEEYKDQFDQLVYHIMMYDKSISETMLVSHFLLGLKAELRHSVEMHLPATVSQASTLAAVQEHLSKQSRAQFKKLAINKAKPKAINNSPELWKVRQLKEFRRANNLCFKCGEKYTPTHKCGTPTGTINLMEHTTVDGGTFLSNEILEALEAPQMFLMEDHCYLSLHALSGQPKQKSIQLRALVKNQALVILLDSSSSQMFLNSALAQKLQLAISPIASMAVKVANGASLSCSYEVKQFEWWIQGSTFQVDAKLLEIGAYDLVLSMDWLERL
jgi:hypothetical protein